MYASCVGKRTTAAAPSTASGAQRHNAEGAPNRASLRRRAKPTASSCIRNAIGLAKRIAASTVTGRPTSCCVLHGQGEAVFQVWATPT